MLQLTLIIYKTAGSSYISNITLYLVKIAGSSYISNITLYLVKITMVTYSHSDSVHPNTCMVW